MDRSPAVILAKRKRGSWKDEDLCAYPEETHPASPKAGSSASVPPAPPRAVVPANTPWGRDLAGTEPDTAKVVFCSLSGL